MSWSLSKVALRKLRDDLGDERARGEPGAEGDHVGVVVLDGLVRRVRLVREAAPDAGDLVGGHDRPGAGAADEDPAIGSPLSDRDAGRHGDVGEVDRPSSLSVPQSMNSVGPVTSRNR